MTEPPERCPKCKKNRGRYRRTMPYPPRWITCPRCKGTGVVPRGDTLLRKAMAVYELEYRRNFPAGGDEADHAEAIRCGVEAVLALSASELAA